MQQLPRRLVQSGASNLVVFGTGAISGVLIARHLGPGSRGDFAIALIWPTLLTVLPSGGLSDAVTYYSSNGRTEGNRVAHSAGLLARRAGYLVAFIGVFISMLPAWRAEVRLGLLIGFAVSPIVVSGAARAGLLLQHSSIHWFRYRVLGPVLQVGLIGGLAASGTLTLITAVSATTVGSVCAAIYALTRPIPEVAGGFRSPHKDMRSYAIRACVGGLPQILNARLDQLLMSFMASPVVLGHYAVATTFAGLPLLASNAVGQHMFASVAGLPDVISRRRAGRVTLLATSVTTLFLALILGPLAYVAIPLVFGPDYEASRRPAVVLLFATVGLAIASSMGQILKGIGRPGLVAYGELTAAIVTVGGLLFVFEVISALAASLVSLVAYFVAALILVFFVHRSLKVDVIGRPKAVGGSSACPATN